MTGLPRAVPFGIALQLMFTGEHIDAAEAYRIGLVNKVVPPADLMAEAEALAERICANAPLSTRAIKEAAYRGSGHRLHGGDREAGRNTGALVDLWRVTHRTREPAQHLE